MKRKEDTVYECKKKILADPPFDSDAFYADLIYKPVPEYNDQAITNAIKQENFSWLNECCPDLDYLLGSRSIADHLLCPLYRAPNNICIEFVKQHSMSLLSLYFVPKLILDEALESRMLKEFRTLVGPRVNLGPNNHRNVLSRILRRWDDLSPGVQRQMGLIRIGLMQKDEMKNIIRFIPPWITKFSQLQFSNLRCGC